MLCKKMSVLTKLWICNQLPFLIEISRINGKIKAVESVKEMLSGDDYKRLIAELDDDILYYKNKYSTSV